MARPPLFINSAVPAKPSSASTTATGVAAREEALRSRPAAVRAREFVRDYPLDELSKRALRVIYSDTDLVVIDKPSGILCVTTAFTSLLNACTL
jgi:23S rRNA-/tRNA-specific pseudouridylate synthase